MQRFVLYFRERAIVVVAGLLAFGFVLAGRVAPRSIPSIVDHELLLVLFALLVAVEALRESTILDRAVVGLLGRFGSARGLTIAFIAMTGLLAMLVTNDVALFVVIPVTVLATRYSSFDAQNAVILEIAAANLLGCLTPLGNPQNLFIYHQSGWHAGQFVATMLPFVAVSAVVLLGAVPLLERGGAIRIHPLPVPRLRAVHAVAGGTVFVLVVLEILRVVPAWPAALAALVVLLTLLRNRIAAIDLSIVPLFFFAFIAVEGLRSLNVYAASAMLPGSQAARLYLSGLFASQVISNVPATILLAPAARGEWALLLYAVNAGGCGTIIASLANLLGWQIYAREHRRDSMFMRRFLFVNFILLALVGVAGWVIWRLSAA